MSLLEIRRLSCRRSSSLPQGTSGSSAALDAESTRRSSSGSINRKHETGNFLIMAREMRKGHPSPVRPGTPRRRCFSSQEGRWSSAQTRPWDEGSSAARKCFSAADSVRSPARQWRFAKRHGISTSSMRKPELREDTGASN
eukprot:scaffold1247_cov251-Pinguiococcus_pyrenoidosus.AAC.21